ncbi:DoxX family protein [Kribbella sp. NPDC048915]|uniref:DoxX family protein n=1 Tax=Kribbella sp. NPDC048915 TaxID=3155148 RepID=UPI00340935D9
MNLALWIVAGLLAVAFAFAGANKLFIPYEKLAKARGAGWVNQFSPAFVKTLGTLEILGAIGLIVPAALDIVPVLVPVAAIGLAIIMVGAAIVTSRRRERAHAAVNVVYLALALFVVVGRFGPEAFG